MRFLLLLVFVACGGRISGAPESMAPDLVCEGPATTGRSVMDDMTNWPPLPGYSAQQGIRFADDKTSAAFHVEISYAEDASAECSATEVDVPVAVWMWSADGRLNERFAATVSRTSATSDVELRKTLAASELGGSLSHQVEATSIELRFTFQRIDGFVEMFGSIYAGDVEIATLE